MDKDTKRTTQREIGDVINELSGSTTWAEFVKWPPNVFALTWTLLAESGAYRNFAGVWLLNTKQGIRTEIQRERSMWIRSALGKRKEAGPSVRDGLQILKVHRRLPLDRIAVSHKLLSAILALHVIADETCAGVYSFSHGASDFDRFTLEAELLLMETGSFAKIPIYHAQVMPKLLTPSVGMTLRSFSNYLTVRRVSEVQGNWFQIPASRTHLDRLNVLLIPWPSLIHATDFRPIRAQGRKRPFANSTGSFEFSPQVKLRRGYIDNVIERAIKQVGYIDVVVLPECAVSEAEFSLVERALSKRSISLAITGLRRAHENCLKFRSMMNRFVVEYMQHKHHPWKLTGRQIQQYGLASSLTPTMDWWESIGIARRAISFIQTGQLSICCLICEDLARAEPTMEVIRAVGPTLIVALLLDGPQLESRWPARYARILNEDPGSSVLTLTSLGMAVRWSRLSGCAPSRAIGYWIDRKFGGRELTLDPDADAMVLTLTLEHDSQQTMDGREVKVPIWYYSSAEQIRSFR